MDVDLLQPKYEEEYEALLRTNAQALFYHSLVWRNVLHTLVGGEPFYLTAKEQGRVVGILPSFLKHGPLGNVLNSLPFYGSNGGVVLRSGVNHPQAVRRRLLEAFHMLAIDQRAILATIITNPLESDVAYYQEVRPPTFQDMRIGQFTPLPLTEDDVDENLLTLFDPVRRRNIRKAQKSGVRCHQSDTLDDLRFLAELHQESIEAIGGLAKSRDFFRSVVEQMTCGQDYCLFIAELEGQRIAGLLTFYFGRIVEYITPAIQKEFRSVQPNSLLIFEAMKDAVRKGFSYWNWGGTWVSQKSLYDFKKRWGTQDRPYYYYVYSYGDLTELLRISRAALLQAYPYFYVVPFSHLVSP